MTTTAMPHGRVLSPVVIGRDSELALITAALDRAQRQRRGTALVLRGEPGVGKTRLARAAVDLAAGRRMETAVGRAVQQGSSAYRPLSEALLQIARRAPVLADPQLAVVRAALGRLVPDWRDPGAAVEESTVVVAEAALRLFRRLGLGDPAGALLVLEDLHWADPETLAVVEYLADNLADEPVVLVATTRPAGPAQLAGAVVDALHTRNAATVLHIDRLSDAEIEAMVRACAGHDVDTALVATVTTRSEGLPLLVEELLSTARPGSTEAIPRTFADSVLRRIATLPAKAVLVLQCAAVLGRRFDWRLLAPVADLPEHAVVAALGQGVSAQLVDVDAGDSFRFHHALTREVVLDSVIPPARAALASRAAQTIEAREAPDDNLELAAELWQLAGDTRRAAASLVGAGRRAIEGGALASAEAVLRRAVELTGDGPAAADVGVRLVEALALAAKVDEAVALGERTLAQLKALGATERQASLHLVLAQAAVGATRWELAHRHLDRAEALGRASGDDRLLARLRSLAAHVAMGERRLEDALALATEARDAAERLDLPEVRCEAYEIIGRRERLRDLDAAEDAFAAAYGVAQDRGLRLFAIRALHELGTIDMFRTASAGRLLEARALAIESGALSLAATVELQLLGLQTFRGELDEAITLGRSLVDTAGRLGSPELHAAALLQLGFAYALIGRREEMDEVVMRALTVAGSNPEAETLAWGHVRATASLMAEDHGRARDELARAMGLAQAAPGVPGIFPALWALLAVLDGAGSEPITIARGLEAQATPINDTLFGFAEAVLLWRAGDTASARRRFDRSDGTVATRQMPDIRHLALRLVAERAVREGWGDGPQWLREAYDHFRHRSQLQVAAACAALLREVGEPVPRTRGDGVPSAIRRRGVTAREHDVLVLVGEHLTNKEIARRLFLSPRTVEKHVERLLQKLGMASRADLARRRWADGAAEDT